MGVIGKPRILILSHVLPFPKTSGQNQRVYYVLKALRPFFHITFLGTAEKNRNKIIEKELFNFCDSVILLQSEYSKNIAAKIWHRINGTIYSWAKSVKFSNYILGEIEFAPSRVETALASLNFDCVLFEYWHASNCIPIFQNKNIPCILDMHNVLWQSYSCQLADNPCIPVWLKEVIIKRYRKQEELSWEKFNALIAINKKEYEYVLAKVGNSTEVFYTPMGIDLETWPYSWQPASPARIAYYGGLGSVHNQRAALVCYEKIMPAIWDEYPESEFWVIGSNPPRSLKALSKKDKRVKITGYIDNIQETLRKVSIIICPWSGTYGFRSRIIEAMALGVPVVSSPEAVYGMTLEEGRGIFFKNTYREIAENCLYLLKDPDFLKEQSILARKQPEEKFSFEKTYGKLAENMLEFIESRENVNLR